MIDTIEWDTNKLAASRVYFVSDLCVLALLYMVALLLSAERWHRVSDNEPLTHKEISGFSS